MTERLDLDLAPDRPPFRPDPQIMANAEGNEKILAHDREAAITLLAQEPKPGSPERQVWKRGLEEAHVHVDERGIVQASEAVVAQLLLDAGWERSA